MSAVTRLALPIDTLCYNVSPLDGIANESLGSHGSTLHEN